jgi:hypothetical protein
MASVVKNHGFKLHKKRKELQKRSSCCALQLCKFHHPKKTAENGRRSGFLPELESFVFCFELFQARHLQIENVIFLRRTGALKTAPILSPQI